MLHNASFRVLVAIIGGALFGYLLPDTGVQMKVCADLFINLVRMLIAPIVFLTVVIGMGRAGDLKSVGRIGAKALIYFEVITTFSLIIGIAVAMLWKPGIGIDISKLAKGDISEYVKPTTDQGFGALLLHLVPSSFINAFAEGDMLQVLFFSVLFGVALTKLEGVRDAVLSFFEKLLQVFFRMLQMVMMLSPFAAFGGMAFTIGKFGIAALLPLGNLMLGVYACMAIFIFLVLNLVMRLSGLSLWKFIKFIKEEILLVLGTSSSESALPALMEKLQELGCSPKSVGILVPAGFSFNLDGTSIYLSMSVLFLAQVFHIDLSAMQLITLLGILMITSKGAAGVSGSGFIVLASTLAASGLIPVEGMAILLGVDRFMSEARAITNLIGNGVATMVIAKSEGALDEAQMNAAYKRGTILE